VVVSFVSVISLKQTTLVLAPILSCLVSELQKPSSPMLEIGQIFGVVAFVNLLAETALVLAPLFCRA
jgi:hypothetical protein